MPQLLPPAANTLPQPSPEDTTAVQNYAKATAQADALAFNSQLTTTWVAWFNGAWLYNYKAGKYPWDANPNPAPPNGFMVETDDSNPFVFTYPQVGPPVCAVPAFDRIPGPPTGLKVSIGKQEVYAPGWWAPNPDNNVPDNYGTTPAPVTTADGVTGLFAWVPSVISGWWKKVG